MSPLSVYSPKKTPVHPGRSFRHNPSRRDFVGKSSKIIKVCIGPLIGKMDVNQIGAHYPRNILITPTRGVGDAIAILPMLRALRKQLPDSRISVLCTPYLSQLFLSEPLDEVIVCEPSDLSLKEKLQFIFTLTKSKYDLAINTGLTANVISFLANIPLRIGFKFEVDERFYFLNNYQKKTPRMHIINQYLSLLEPLGIESPPVKDMSFYIPEEAKNFAAKFLSQQDFNQDSPIIGIHTSCSPEMLFKLWDIGNFSRLIEMLSQEFPFLKFVIFDHKWDSSRISHVPLLFTGNLSLMQLASVIDKCRLLICPDSGPMHIAKARGIPTAAIFGPTDPEIFGYQSPENIIIRKDIPCSPCASLRSATYSCQEKEQRCLSIDPDEVFIAVKQLMQKLKIIK